MRKVIGGRTYNTETSKLVGKWSNGHNYSDFAYCREMLYRNTKGAYFLYGEGGAMSKYATSVGNNTCGGEEIRPLTAEEAQEWAERHLDGEDVEMEFGPQEEAEPSDLATRERVNLTIDSSLMSKLREHSKDIGVPMSRLIDRAILNILEDRYR